MSDQFTCGLLLLTVEYRTERMKHEIKEGRFVLQTYLSLLVSRLQGILLLFIRTVIDCYQNFLKGESYTNT